MFWTQIFAALCRAVHLIASSCFSAAIIDHWALSLNSTRTLRMLHLHCRLCRNTVMSNLALQDRCDEPGCLQSWRLSDSSHLYERVALDTTALFQSLIADVGQTRGISVRRTPFTRTFEIYLGP